MKKKSILRKDIILLIGLLLCFFALQFLIQISGRIRLIEYRGVFSAIQYGACLLMMLVNLKYGSRLAIILMSITLIPMSITLYFGSVNALPGLCNTLFYIITIVVIARYDTKREIESRTDTITGVFNRKGLYIELKDKINKGNELSIIYISLNNFKAINDSYGHAFGDELLRKITKRVEVKFGNSCIISRMGGAEFAIAFDGNMDAQLTADRLLESIREKTILVVDDNRVDYYIDCFAGVSKFPDDTSDYEELIKFADIAMTEAVNNKSKHAYMFDKKMIDNISRQVHLRKLIKEGLLKEYFYLVYQPQYKLDGKELRGFETLLRMKTTDGEFVSPGEFIPVAEKSDLIFQIDDYVIARAMREFRDIVRKNTALTVSINVSAKDFADIGFVEKIKRNLTNTDFPAQNLEIEITEYCMVNSMDVTTDNINALRDMGVKVALDDFGTGYTALNYVASLPFDLLKIDKSLIDNIETDPKRRDFVRAVITMGQLMDCEIISEGVENDMQIDCLKEDGCDLVQGFVWGKPMMYEDAVKLAL